MIKIEPQPEFHENDGIMPFWIFDCNVFLDDDSLADYIENNAFDRQIGNAPQDDDSMPVLVGGVWYWRDASHDCCFCGKEIEDWDGRHDAHREGCNHGTDEWEGCDCDMPCHPECCPDCNGSKADLEYDTVDDDEEYWAPGEWKKDLANG